MNPIRKRFYGEQAQAQYGTGRKLLGILHNHMLLGGLSQAVMRKWVDGVYFEVSSVFGQDEVRVFNTSGNPGVVSAIEDVVGQISTTHILWGNLNPGSVKGYFSAIGNPDPEVAYPDQKRGFLKGLEEGGALSMTLDGPLMDQLRISTASPAIHITGSFDRKTYAYLLSIDEFEESYKTFGEGDFKEINVASWYLEGGRYDAIDLFGLTTGEYLNDASYAPAFGFYSAYFNNIRVGSFLAAMYLDYFRADGNPSNANFDDEVVPPMQSKYLVQDLYGGVFIPDAIEILYPGFGYPAWPTTYAETFGSELVDLIKEDFKDTHHYYYTSHIAGNDESENVMQMPPDLESLFDNVKTYEQKEFDYSNEFFTVPLSAQEGLLRDLGKDLGEQIATDSIAKLLTQQGAQFDRGKIITTSGE